MVSSDQLNYQFSCKSEHTYLSVGSGDSAVLKYLTTECSNEIHVAYTVSDR